ncbi:MAG TPA: formyltransferase family protein, partial [Candidatus Polarisedimenticolia bacterium]|nr:formyltransferase family protein [Candidatus Polarisedimenticolia bacterium]
MVVFTAGPLSAVNRVFFERLAGDPLLDLLALIVDERANPRKPLAARVLRGIRRDGWLWLWFKLATLVGAFVRRAAVFLFELAHKRAGSDESYEVLERATGVRVDRVADIQSAESLTLIRSLRPQLGVIVGGRILRDAVIAIPEYGTLNIHKRKVPEYRGGGPVGYWEILAGERSIGVTIHYATSQVDAGPVLAETAIPIEECDTLESLRIKADIAGARLYHDAIRRVASGDRGGAPQDTSRGATYRSPSD